MKRLWVLVLFGIAYIGWLYGQRTLTGVDRTDGIIGVVLGLFICSHPAAHLVEMLFFRRSDQDRSSSRFIIYWLGLNILVMLIGWATVFVGTMRLMGGPR
jgi:hypothetical protein